jgi:hypothetical protein
LVQYQWEVHLLAGLVSCLVIVFIFLLIVIKCLTLSGPGCEVIAVRQGVEGTEGFCDQFGDLLFERFNFLFLGFLTFLS